MLARLSVGRLDPSVVQRVRQIPGVRVTRRHEILSPLDIAPILARQLGVATDDGARAALRTPARLPETIRGWKRLRDYQRDDALALATDRRRLLWSCAGSGKTAVLLAALDLVGARRALVVTSAKGRKNWALDCRIAGSRRVAIVVGRKPGKSADAEARRLSARLSALRDDDVFAFATTRWEETRDADTVVATWETFTEPRRAAVDGEIVEVPADRLAEALGETWDAVVFDEHHKAKNWRSGRTRIADALVEATRPEGAAALVVWGATATPITDRRRDLLAQLGHVDAETWATFVDLNTQTEPNTPRREPDWKPSFTVRYCDGHYGPFGEWDDSGPHPVERCTSCARVAEDRSRELDYRLDCIAVRRSYESLRAAMPRKTRKIVSVPFDARHLGASRGKSGREALLAIAFAAKIDTAIEDALEVLIGDGKLVLVVGDRNDHADIALAKLGRALAKNRPLRERLWLEVAHIDVGTRVEQAERFGRRQRCAVLVSTIGKIAESMNGLQFTDHAFVVGVPTTYRDVAQVEGRFSRLDGWPVTVSYYLAEATIDEPLEQALFAKIDAVEASGADTVGDGFVGWKRPPPRDEDVRASVLAWIVANAKKIDGASAVDEE